MSLLDVHTSCLNDVLRSIERALWELKLGVEAEVDIPEHQFLRLRFAKDGGDWILMIVREESGLRCQTPLIGAGRAHRIAAVSSLPNLLRKLQETHEAKDQEVVVALAKAQDFLKRLQNESSNQAKAVT